LSELPTQQAAAQSITKGCTTEGISFASLLAWSERSLVEPSADGVSNPACKPHDALPLAAGFEKTILHLKAASRHDNAGDGKNRPIITFAASSSSLA